MLDASSGQRGEESETCCMHPAKQTSQLARLGHKSCTLTPFGWTAFAHFWKVKRHLPQQNNSTAQKVRRSLLGSRKIIYVSSIHIMYPASCIVCCWGHAELRTMMFPTGRLVSSHAPPEWLKAAHPSMHNPNHPGAQLLSCQHILHWVSPLWWPGNNIWNHET